MTPDKVSPLDALDAFFTHWDNKVKSGQSSSLDRLEVITLGMFAMWLEENEYELIKRGEHGITDQGTTTD